MTQAKIDTLKLRVYPVLYIFLLAIVTAFICVTFGINVPAIILSVVFVYLVELALKAERMKTALKAEKLAEQYFLMRLRSIFGDDFVKIIEGNDNEKS